MCPAGAMAATSSNNLLSPRRLLDVGTGTPEEAAWLASESRGVLLANVAAAGGWFEYVAGAKLTEVRFRQEGRYEACKSRGSQADQDAHHQIDLDLHRTFISEDVPATFLASLSDVLHAYAVHNPKIGYCQGMNFIAAVCLRTMTEEEAFWVLAYMVERLFPDYFTNMEGALADKQCIDWLLQTSLPEVADHFTRLDGLPAVLWQALLCIFANNIVPSEGVYVLWAALFRHGRVHLLRLLCHAVHRCRDPLLRADSADSLRQIMVHYFSHLYDASALVCEVEEPPATGAPLCWLTFSSAHIWGHRDSLMASYQAQAEVHRDGIQVLQLARATKLPVELLQRWCDEFHLLLQQQCHGRNGATAAEGLGLATFCQLMTNLTVDEQVVNLFKLFDIWNARKPKGLDFAELVTGLLTLSDRVPLEARLHVCFESYDNNDSGVLEAEEVRDMLASRHWAEIIEGHYGGELLSPEGTITCAHFCSALGSYQGLPLPLRDGLALSRLRLFCVLQSSHPQNLLRDLVGNTVRTLGSELGKVLETQVRKVNPQLPDAARDAIRTLHAQAFGASLPTPAAPALLHARLTASEVAQVYAMLCVPPQDTTIHGSVLWEPYTTDAHVPLALERYLPRGPVYALYKGLRTLLGERWTGRRLVTSAPTHTVLALTETEADADLAWAWALQTMKTPEDVEWHLRAYKWLATLNNLTMGVTVTGENGAELIGSPRYVVAPEDLRREAATLLADCGNAEQLWYVYRRVLALPNAGVVECLRPEFQARIPGLFQEWVQGITHPAEVAAMADALRASKPALDPADSRLADLALNRMEELLAIRTPSPDPSQPQP